MKDETCDGCGRPIFEKPLVVHLYRKGLMHEVLFHDEECVALYRRKHEEATAMYCPVNGGGYGKN